jgi:hypothetical protein
MDVWVAATGTTTTHRCQGAIAEITRTTRPRDQREVLTISQEIEAQSRRRLKMMAMDAEMDTEEAEMSRLGSRTRIRIRRTTAVKITARVTANALRTGLVAGERRTRTGQNAMTVTIATIEMTATLTVSGRVIGHVGAGTERTGSLSVSQNGWTNLYRTRSRFVPSRTFRSGRKA